MAYHIYTTDGIILKRKALGEADIVLYVLTENLGLIITSARSARLNKSKLRGALQEYTLVSISCVKGKNGWKITNVTDKENFFWSKSNYSNKVLAQISSLLLQMIQGESRHPEIFQTTKTAFEFLKFVSEKNIGSFEVLAILRILYQLGYVAIGPDTEIFLKNTTEWSELFLEKIVNSKKVVVELINKGLKESHL